MARKRIGNTSAFGAIGWKVPPRFPLAWAASLRLHLPRLRTPRVRGVSSFRKSHKVKRFFPWKSPVPLVQLH